MRLHAIQAFLFRGKRVLTLGDVGTWLGNSESHEMVGGRFGYLHFRYESDR